MKFLKPIATALFLFLAVHAAVSQAVCGFDGMHKQLMAKDSSYRKAILANNVQLQQYLRKHPPGISGTLRGSSVTAVLYTIPVVIHVIHTGGAIGSVYNPTDAQITGAIDYLNQVYNGTYPGTEGVGDLQIQFALATRDTNCNASTGIDRIDGSSMANYASNGVNSSTGGGVSDLTLKNFDRWDPTSYYNIWVVNKIDAKDGTSGQFIAGYAYFAGASASQDGTVMLATQMKTGAKTLPHEIGHALAIYHPFQGSPDAATCPANADCTADGDAVCDTDPITYNQTGGIVDFSCRTGTNSCSGSAYSINTEHNFMNYTNCYTLFTAGQKARMQAAMSLPSRQSLANSPATGSYPVASYTAPIAPVFAPATSATGLSNNYAGVMSITISNRTFGSSTAKIDGGYVDKTGKCLNLISLQRNNTYNFSITALGANTEQVWLGIDYNNNGSFTDAGEQLYYSNVVGTTTLTGSFTVPATAVLANTLRLRVMDNLATGYGMPVLNGSASSLTYGQAEDYPVYLSTLLPVKIDYFNGIKRNSDAVLNWKTSTEENAKEFQVEKSTDGVSFSMIGTVAASNAATGSAYSYTDKNIRGAVNYYRLKQVDKDLRASVSDVVVIKAATSNNAGFKLLNNPFSNQLNVYYNGRQTDNSTINLFDITGRKVFSKSYSVSDGQVLTVDVASLVLKPGVYVLQAQAGEVKMTQKVIKQ